MYATPELCALNSKAMCLISLIYFLQSYSGDRLLHILFSFKLRMPITVYTVFYNTVWGMQDLSNDTRSNFSELYPFRWNLKGSHCFNFKCNTKWIKVWTNQSFNYNIKKFNRNRFHARDLAIPNTVPEMAWGAVYRL